MLKWDPNDIRVIAFFNKFPATRKVDVEIRAVPDLDLLYFAIVSFVLTKNQRKFIEIILSKEINKSYRSPVYRSACTIPKACFRGYFHDVSSPCTDGIRLGNPKDRSYGYSFDIPAMRTVELEQAFTLGSIPCPKCFEKELSRMRTELAPDLSE